MSEVRPAGTPGGAAPAIGVGVPGGSARHAAIKSPFLSFAALSAGLLALYSSLQVPAPLSACAAAGVAETSRQSPTPEARDEMLDHEAGSGAARGARYGRLPRRLKARNNLFPFSARRGEPSRVGRLPMSTAPTRPERTDPPSHIWPDLSGDPRSFHMAAASTALSEDSGGRFRSCGIAISPMEPALVGLGVLARVSPCPGHPLQLGVRRDPLSGSATDHARWRAADRNADPWG